MIRVSIDGLIKELKADWWKLANIITGLRLIGAAVPIGFILWDPNNIYLRWAAVIVFVALIATDALDGYVARRRDEVTDLGKQLDPLADKVLIISTLITLSIVDYLDWLILSLTVITVLRETYVTWLRMRAKRKGKIIAAIFIGKLKMVAQSVTVTMLLLPSGLMDPLIIKGIIVVTIIIIILSGVEYHMKFLKLGNSKEKAIVD